MSQTPSQRLEQAPGKALVASLEQLAAWKPELPLAQRDVLDAVSRQTIAFATSVLNGYAEDVLRNMQLLYSHGGNLFSQVLVPGENQQLGARVMNFFDWQLRWSRVMRDLSLMLRRQIDEIGENLEAQRSVPPGNGHLA